ncbi:response regulator [Rhizobium sp. RAF56]|jgi:CheY-like chemotaxis protein
MGVPTSVKIVMIEDDLGHARLIEKNIRRAGVTNEIVPFVTGAEAIDYLLGPDGTGKAWRGEPILILLDLNLPDMNGLDILEKVKNSIHMRRAMVIVLTTTDDPREIGRSFDLGANVYVTKPMQYDNFVHAIQQLGMFVAIMKIPEVE